MSPLQKLFGDYWQVYLEVQFFSFWLKEQERQDLGEALALICAEHINAQTTRK